jgi:hypothetical protein
MAEYDNSNRGKVWKNEKKETDNHPDFTGSQNVICAGCGQAHDYWVNAWRRKPDASDRAPALSWTTKPKDGKPVSKPAARKPVADDMDGDEIPF